MSVFIQTSTLSPARALIVLLLLLLPARQVFPVFLEEAATPMACCGETCCCCGSNGAYGEAAGFNTESCGCAVSESEPGTDVPVAAHQPKTSETTGPALATANETLDSRPAASTDQPADISPAAEHPPPLFLINCTFRI